MPHWELVVKNAEVYVTTDNGAIERVNCDIALAGGQIQALGSLPATQAERVLDATGLTILPGIIDSHVHFREPGMEAKEDLTSGSAAALLGGVTGVIEMPNTKPPTVSAIDLADKMNRAKHRMWCHYGFYLGATQENIPQLDSLEKLPGCLGIKVFMGCSTGNLLVSDDPSIARTMTQAHGLIGFHAEDENRLQERRRFIQPNNPASHPIWRDAESAAIATQRVLALAEKTGHPAHLLHVSTGDEIEAVKKFRQKHPGLVTVESAPQYLTLSAPECYERLGTLAQMNPPIRTREHQNALWEAISDGTIDTLASDHAPHLKLEKDRPYPDSPSGLPGVQTILPLMLNHCANGRLSMVRLVQLLSSRPAEIFCLKGKGAIRIGYDADLTIVDRKKEVVLDNSMMASKCHWTPYAGLRVQGWPTITVVNGQVSMRDGEILGSPRGLPFLNSRFRTSKL